MSDENNEHTDEPRHGDAGTPPPEDMVEDFDLHMPDDMDIRRCYRHPERETGVSCSNCGKPICYECMTPAPVGFRCPDCMAEQRGGLRAIPGGRAVPGVRTGTQQRPRVITRQQTRARWQSGGLLGTSGSPVTRVLVGMNIAVFILEIATSGGGGLMSGLGGPLYQWGALYPPYIAVNHEYWRLFTAMFLHANLFHILFNMWALYIAGSYLEVLAGRTKYLLIYFISGFAGNVLAYAIGPKGVPVVGASTAIFGLFAALFIYSVHNRHTVAGMALRSMGFVILINLFITFTMSSISWQGHIGGLLGGVAAMEALVLAGRKDIRDRIEFPDGAAVVAIVAVLVLLTIWRSFTF
jgi:membrane associated rhomboid family serine protease